MKVKIRLAASKVRLVYKGHDFPLFESDANEKFCIKDKDILNHDAIEFPNVEIGDIGNDVDIILPD